ncbi:hypothetical protein D0863_14284 [Hortaea werneckii]|uniref:Uncharacterized protein n=1 Tax=Hortaea werneckii TaxID=91943 RepID=A0A3M7CK41_HORWE|nr:hypothetical protein D0863_14284 [Hortaea werneckii]
MLPQRPCLDDQPLTVYDTLPDTLSPEKDPPPSPKHPIDEALQKVAVAVAAFRRAGPHYARPSSAFLFFARGSWTRARYVLEVRNAGSRLPKQVSAEQDVMFAERMVGEALVVLRREGLQDDVGDLEWAVRQFRAGGFPL